MFRSLFGRPRTIRVPINNGNVQVQEVNVISGRKIRSRSFIVNLLMAYIVYRMLESRDLLDISKKSKSIEEDVEKWKKDHPTRNKDNLFGKHWQEQHAQMRSNGKIEGTTTETPLGAGI